MLCRCGAFVAPCGLRGGRAWDLTSDLQTLPRLWVGVLGSWMRRTKHIFVSNMEGCTVRFTAVHSVHMRRMVGSLRSRAPAPVSVRIRSHKRNSLPTAHTSHNSQASSVVKIRDFVPTKIIT